MPSDGLQLRALHLSPLAGSAARGLAGWPEGPVVGGYGVLSGGGPRQSTGFYGLALVVLHWG